MLSPVIVCEGRSYDRLGIGTETAGFHAPAQVLDAVGLTGVDLRQRPESLSDGYKRRLALAVQVMPTAMRGDGMGSNPTECIFNCRDAF